jgi:DNA-nicking Smr family endonuclease
LDIGCDQRLMARKRRQLSDDDRALWKKVTQGAERLTPCTTHAQTIHNPCISESGQVTVTKPVAKCSFRPEGPKSHGGIQVDLAPQAHLPLARQSVKMDKRAFDRMRRGKLQPEARIDLHGMTMARAHPALINFIHHAYARQFRLVLVITGKGKRRQEPAPMPERHGVLRHNVPHWLTMAPMRLMVLEVVQAHQRHGGDGAYYVYLRRQR